MRRILNGLVLGIICLVGVNNVLAHPGRTDASGCHYCRTNCAKWGLKDNEYHCHNEKNETSSTTDSNVDNNTSSQTNSNSNNNTSNQTKKQVVKSSDNSIKLIEINGEEIKVSSDMHYETELKVVSITAVTSSSKATLDYEKSISLGFGNNQIIIKVIAENGDVKNYQLNIKRIEPLNVLKEEKLSNNKDIKIMLDGKTVNFISYQSDKIVIPYDKDELNIMYWLADEKARVEIIGNDNIGVGNNTVLIRVTAENGDFDDYKIMVEKEKHNSITSNIMGLGVFGGSGYGVYYLIKKKKYK